MKRSTVGESTVWNQVFGGDGLGVGMSQANANASFCSVPENIYFRAINSPPDNQSKLLSANTFIFPDYFPNAFTPLITPSASFDSTGYIFVTYTPTFIDFTSGPRSRWLPLANIDEGNGYGPSNIMAGAPFTVFFDHWSLFGANLPQARVTDMYIPPDGTFLRISTYGRGVWEISL